MPSRNTQVRQPPRQFFQHACHVRLIGRVIVDAQLPVRVGLCCDAGHGLAQEHLRRVADRHHNADQAGIGRNRGRRLLAQPLSIDVRRGDRHRDCMRTIGIGKNRSDQMPGAEMTECPALWRDECSSKFRESDYPAWTSGITSLIQHGHVLVGPSFHRTPQPRTETSHKTAYAQSDHGDLPLLARTHVVGRARCSNSRSASSARERSASDASMSPAMRSCACCSDCCPSATRASSVCSWVCQSAWRCCQSSWACCHPAIRLVLALLQLLRIGRGSTPLALGDSKIGDVAAPWIAIPSRNWRCALRDRATHWRAGQQRGRFRVEAGTEGRGGLEARGIALQANGNTVFAIGLITVVAGEHSTVVETVGGADQRFQLRELHLDEMCAHQTGPQCGIALAETQHLHAGAFKC
uniref:Transposase n=1 Tax=Heterorhabditis bacteriophora TaxID=37862 RepID=A0A1I7WDI3_HETBA